MTPPEAQPAGREAPGDGRRGRGHDCSPSRIVRMNLLDALYLPAAALSAPWWARKTRSGWSQRFGHIGRLPAPCAGTKRILLHAVSVGEVNTLRGLVPMLRSGGAEVVVSAGTDTGLARAQSLFSSLDGVHVVRYALDFSPAVRRFLDAVRPDAVALVELEVWPNFVRACAARNIPVGVINGRLSARSFRGYSRFRRFFASTFGSLAFAAVQDEDYAQRFLAMGVPADRVHVTGSMKWDAAAIVEPGHPVEGAEALARAMGIDPSRPLIVGGSTAPIDGGTDPCEEALLDRACPPDVQLLCAPRKPEHFDTAFSAMGGPARCTRRSSGLRAAPGTSRFLLDTIGELRAAYALADVVVIGRTFGELGGSDPIEPISLSRAVVIGPRYTNFQSVVAEFAAANAIVECTPSDLPAVLRDLLADKPRRDALITRGLGCIRAHQGATHRHADMLLALAGSSPNRP